MTSAVGVGDWKWRRGLRLVLHGAYLGLALTATGRASGEVAALFFLSQLALVVDSLVVGDE